MKKKHPFNSPEFWIYLFSAMCVVISDSYFSNRESGSAPVKIQMVLSDSIIGLLSYSGGWMVRSLYSSNEGLRGCFLLSFVGSTVYIPANFSYHLITDIFSIQYNENVFLVGVGSLIILLLGIGVYTVPVTFIFYSMRYLIFRNHRVASINSSISQAML